MKKKIFYILIFFVTGIILGRKIYIATNNYEVKSSNPKTYYFLQKGVYSNKEILNENLKHLNIKIIETINDKYHVYLGITKNYKIAQKLKEIYEQEGHQIYIKEVDLDNLEFDNYITQFDLLLENANNKNEILTIEEVVLANYEEIIQKNN